VTTGVLRDAITKRLNLSLPKVKGDWFYGDLGYIAFTFRAGKFESAKAQAEKQ